MIGTLRRLQLVDPSGIVTEGLVARDMSGRHRLDLVDGAVQAVVKAPGREGPPRPLDTERQVLAWLAGRCPDVGPRLIAWDPAEEVLVTEFFSGETPAVITRRLGGLPPVVAAGIGAALAVLHSQRVTQDPAAEVPDVLVYQLRPTPAALAFRTQGQLELTRLIQRSRSVGAALDDAAGGWRATAAIHGDIRWGNVIVDTARGSDKVVVRLVDWESAGRGDPCWDVGAAAASAIFDRLDLPLGAVMATHELVAAADGALRLARPAVSALWAAWVDGHGGTGAAEADAALRTARYAGARLLELAHGVAGEFDRLPIVAALVAQLGVDLLTRPAEGAEVLLRAVGADPAVPL